MAFLASNRKVLLLHDGELKDVRHVVESLGAQVLEQIGPDAPARWDLAIATPRYLQAISSANGDARFKRVAFLDNDSRTLRTLIRRSGIHVVVRRPIHPAALRLLVVHALYRGPERRKPRVAAGEEIRFFYPFKRGRGVVAELSAEGCRLLVEEPIGEGTWLLLNLPDPEQRGAPIAVPAKVLRIGAGEGSAAHSLGLQFFWLTGATRKRIRSAMEAYARAPARLADSAVAPPGSADDTRAGPAAEGQAAPEQRGTPRIPFEHRVMAHDQEASRILFGRDLSVGGIKVDPHPDLKIGKTMRVAIHVGDGEESLSIRARVLRDDGSRGVALRFVDVPMSVQESLNKLVSGPAPIAETVDDGEEEIILTEILEDDE